jgi:hypothetical protein
MSPFTRCSLLLFAFHHFLACRLLELRFLPLGDDIASRYSVSRKKPQWHVYSAEQEMSSRVRHGSNKAADPLVINVRNLSFLSSFCL